MMVLVVAVRLGIRLLLHLVAEQPETADHACSSFHCLSDVKRYPQNPFKGVTHRRHGDALGMGFRSLRAVLSQVFECPPPGCT
jgi:hypothetical protein